MRYKAGDKVRVRSDLQISRRYGSYTFAPGMDHYKGSVVTISKAHQNLYFYCIEEDRGRWIWADEMFEPVEDELTAEEAIRRKCEMCESISCSECKFSRLNNGEDLYCNKFLEKYPEQVVEILKQWKKDYEKKEVEVVQKIYCLVIDEKRTVVHEEEIDNHDSCEEVLKRYCEEHDGKFFAIAECRYEVKG